MKWIVPGQQKLVAFIQQQLSEEVSGKQLRRALEANLCRINGRIERFGSKEVRRGDEVELSSSWKTLLQPRQSGIRTVYEDDFFKIIDKPVSWVCTDAEALRTLGPKHYLVHRLDKDTTGLLIVAKSPKVRDALMELFEKREVVKTYLTLVDGHPKEESGVRSTLLMKKSSFEGQTVWGSGPQGLTAVTNWKVLARGKCTSLVECQPETGRTHQIRVHLSEMGHPILGDRQYAKHFRCKLFIQRPLLHAFRLQFVHPMTHHPIDVTAELPTDFTDAKHADSHC